jgi:hypothetical protein
MLYVIFGFKFDIQLKKTMWKIQYKPIKYYHMENVVFRKDFKLGATSSFFHAFT